MAFTTIDDSEAYFQTVLYTGNGTAIGSGGLSVTFGGDTDLAPGLLWLKRRDGDVSVHVFHDAVRGAQTRFYPSDGYGEDTSVTESVNAFTSDGFNLGNSGQGNGSGNKHWAACWKAGTTSGIGTAGQDITPSAYSIDTTSKFGIYAYTGNGTADQQINHGLGAAPAFMINKVRSNSDQDWHVFLNKLQAQGGGGDPEDFYLYLNTEIAPTDRAESWQDTLPDTTDFTLGDSHDGNQDGQTFMLYAWAEVQGFMRTGIYGGMTNEDTNGVYNYCGFKPALIMIKAAYGSKPWLIFDNKRDGRNGANESFDMSSANETTAEYVEIYSNGFKIIGAQNDINQDDVLYMWTAWAESPFVNSNGVPNNAR